MARICLLHGLRPYYAMGKRGVIPVLAGLGLCCAWMIAIARVHNASGFMQILSPGEIGEAAIIIDGDTFALDNGLRVNLSGIVAPLSATLFHDRPTELLAQEAKRALSIVTKGQRVQLFYGDDRRDRYERAQAQISVLDAQGNPDIWLQAVLVEKGLARVYPWAGDGVDVQDLYRLEETARVAGLGIWSLDNTNGFFAVRSPEPNALIQYVDSIQIVEGIVISTADVRGTQYLNFGSDYKTDFTIVVSKKHRRIFEKAGLDLQALEGARVRVRGYIEIGNGPVIWLQIPTRLEILQ